MFTLVVRHFCVVVMSTQCLPATVTIALFTVCPMQLYWYYYYSGSYMILRFGVTRPTSQLIAMALWFVCPLTRRFLGPMAILPIEVPSPPGLFGSSCRFAQRRRFPSLVCAFGGLWSLGPLEPLVPPLPLTQLVYVVDD